MNQDEELIVMEHSGTTGVAPQEDATPAAQPPSADGARHPAPGTRYHHSTRQSAQAGADHIAPASSR